MLKIENVITYNNFINLSGPCISVLGGKCSSAIFSRARASSEYPSPTNQWGSKHAIDGIVSEESSDIFSSRSEDYPWLELEMPEGNVSGVVIVTTQTFQKVEIRAGMNSIQVGYKGILTINTKVAYFAGPAPDGQTFTIHFEMKIVAKFISIQCIDKDVFLEINEALALVP